MSDATSAPAQIVDYFISLFYVFESTLDSLLKPVEETTKAVLSSLAPSVYSNVGQYFASSASPFASRLPLMNFFHVLVITLSYLVLVFGGKALMEKREKFNMRPVSLLHNLFLVLLSTYMCGTILSEAWRQGYGLFGNPVDKTEGGWQMAKYTWLFYVSKIAEFMDTYIMVLKKNTRQITFLHVYHHCSIFVIWWVVVYIAPNGETYFSAALNSAVHIVMYGYYLSTTLSIPIRFIKRYITLFQMTQFTMMMIQATYDIILFRLVKADSEEKYPFDLAALLWIYMWTMLGLFANFFKKDRLREQHQKLAKKE